MSPKRRIPEGGLSALKSPTGPPPRATFKPVERPDPVPVADETGYVLTPQEEFDRIPPAPVQQWVELPDTLIQRLYALDLGPDADDLIDRIVILVGEAEGRQPRPPQCPYEFPPLDNGVVLACQHTAGHDGDCEPYCSDGHKRDNERGL